jgi:hypothetical protein
MPISNPGSSELAGWHVGPDGRVGIGTASLDDGASLTVDAGGNISLHGEQVRLTSPTSTPPSLVADATIGLQTEGGSSIVLRSGSEVTEYTAVSGIVETRGGHRFRTGSEPETRMCIADDGVALDVPLRLKYCSVSSLPAASTHGGCLITIVDRGATLQLAFSDGLHWYVLTSEDWI